jgi:predicted lipid-binding transport protein (Tim44 family)
MSAQLPARRVRNRFMRFGFWTSAVVFVVIEGNALLDQSEIGHASVLFMFGTACLAAAACLGLFAIILAIGLVVSAAFRGEPRPEQSDHSQDAPAVTGAHISHLPAASPALARSSPRKRRQPPRIHAFAKEGRKAPPQAP